MAKSYLNPEQPKKKDSGGILGFAKKTAGGALGGILDTLSAPQQAIFKPVAGIARAVRGEGIDEVFKGFGQGLAEVGSLGAGTLLPGVGSSFFRNLAGDDLSLTQTIAAGRDDEDTFRLPTGMETVGGILTDPTTYLTLGVGGAAKSALTTAGKAGVKSLADDVAKQGLRSVVKQNPAAKGILEDAFRRSAQEAGVKNVEKAVAKNMKALTRAQGGVGLKVPFGRNFQLISGDTLSRAPGAGLGRAAKTGIKESRPSQFMADRFVRGARAARDTDVGREAADRAFAALGARSSAAAKSIADAQTEWKAGVRATEEAGLKYTVEQDRLVREALEQGEDARNALIAAEPKLAPVVEAADRIRKAIGDEQFKAGVIGKDYSEMQAKLATKVDEGIDRAQSLGDEFTTAKQQATQAGRNARQASAVAEQVRAQRKGVQAGTRKAEGVLQKAVLRVQDLEAKATDRAFKSALADEVKRVREAVEAGYPPPGISKVYDLANDPLVIKNATERAAREVADNASLQAARARALRLGEKVYEGTGEAAALKSQVSELKKLATGATKEAAKGQRAAGRLGSRAAKARRELNELGDRLAAIPEGATGLKDPDTYMRRMLTPEAKKLLRGAKGKELRARVTGPSTGIGSAAQGAVIQRKVAQGYTAKAINEAIELVRTGKRGLVDSELLADKDFMAIADRLATSKKPVKLFDEGTAVPLMARQAEAARAISTARVVEDLKAIPGAEGRPLMIDAAERTAQMQADEGFKRYVKVDVPGMGEYYVPPGLQEDIKQAFYTLQPDTVAGALKAANKWQAFWKTWATAMLPGGIPFAARNARSNLYLNMLDGVPYGSPSYAKAAGMMKKAHGIARSKTHAEAIAREGLDTVLLREMGKDAELLIEAQKRGVLDKSFFDIDFEDFDASAKQLGVRGAAPDKNIASRALRFQFSTQGGMAKGGRALNQAVEHHARLTNFLHNAQKLGNLDEAAAHTKTALFDYSALTPFEAKIMKNVIPFYTFMRKNIPQQYKTAITDPRLITLPENIASAATTEGPEDMPAYMDRANARMPGAQGLLGSLGLGGLVSTSDRPLAAAADVIDPLSAIVAAIAPGQQGMEPEGWAPFFRQIDESVGGPIPGILRYLQEEGAGKSDFTGGTLPTGTDNRIRRAVDALVPGLGRSLRLSGSLNTDLGGPADKDTKDLTQSEILRFLSGIRLDEVGTAAGGGRAKSGSKKAAGGKSYLGK